MSKNKPKLRREFHYYDWTLEPYKANPDTANRLMKDLFGKIFPTGEDPVIKVLNRHEGRKNANRRELFILSYRILRGGNRARGKICLIRDRLPKEWDGAITVSKLKQKKNREFIEETSFMVDYSSPIGPKMMIEFNHFGPRASDLTWYIRQVSREYKIATKVQSSLLLKRDYKSLEKNIQNIFSISVKVHVSDLLHLNGSGWLQSFQNLQKQHRYKESRLEVFFGKEPGAKKGTYKVNAHGNDEGRNWIQWLRNNDSNIEHLQELKMDVMMDGGHKPEWIDFIQNKFTSILYVESEKSGKYVDSKQFNHVTGQEFNKFLLQGKTTIQKDPN